MPYKLYRQNGKQVLFRDLHFADARNELAAKTMVDALNAWCHPLNLGCPKEYQLDE